MPNTKISSYEAPSTAFLHSALSVSKSAGNGGSLPIPPINTPQIISELGAAGLKTIASRYPKAAKAVEITKKTQRLFTKAMEGNSPDRSVKGAAIVAGGLAEIATDNGFSVSIEQQINLPVAAGLRVADTIGELPELISGAAAEMGGILSDTSSFANKIGQVKGITDRLVHHVGHRLGAPEESVTQVLEKLSPSIDNVRSLAEGLDAHRDQLPSLPEGEITLESGLKYSEQALRAGALLSSSPQARRAIGLAEVATSNGFSANVVDTIGELPELISGAAAEMGDVFNDTSSYVNKIGQVKGITDRLVHHVGHRLGAPEESVTQVLEKLSPTIDNIRSLAEGLDAHRGQLPSVSQGEITLENGLKYSEQALRAGALLTNSPQAKKAVGLMDSIKEMFSNRVTVDKNEIRYKFPLVSVSVDVTDGSIREKLAGRVTILKIGGTNNALETVRNGVSLVVQGTLLGVGLVIAGVAVIVAGIAYGIFCTLKNTIYLPLKYIASLPINYLVSYIGSLENTPYQPHFSHEMYTNRNLGF